MRLRPKQNGRKVNRKQISLMSQEEEGEEKKKKR